MCVQYRGKLESLFSVLDGHVTNTCKVHFISFYAASPASLPDKPPTQHPAEYKAVIKINTKS